MIGLWQMASQWLVHVWNRFQKRYQADLQQPILEGTNSVPQDLAHSCRTTLIQSLAWLTNNLVACCLTQHLPPFVYTKIPAQELWGNKLHPPERCCPHFPHQELWGNKSHPQHAVVHVSPTHACHACHFPHQETEVLASVQVHRSNI